jgi:hypothetical protein
MARSRRTFAAFGVLSGVLLTPIAASSQPRQAAPLQRPFYFEPNAGQAATSAAFLAQGRGFAIHVSAAEAAFRMRDADVRMRFVNAAARRQVEGIDRLPGTSSYLRGSDPAQWRTAIAQYARVRVAGIYPGIDVVYYGRNGELEYDLIVAAGADPSVVALTFAGADKVRIDADGEVVVSAAGRELRQRRPVIYQDTPDGRRHIAGRYTIDRSRHVRFRIGEYDRSRPLVIDPVLIYAGYLGGTGLDDATGVAVDGLGYMYITGHTGPNTGFEDVDAFVAKFDPTGSRLLYAFTFGGTNHERPAGIAVDGAGAVYVAGTTHSDDFPVRAAFQPDFHDEPFFPTDGFITKINPGGTAVVYSSYLGGSSSDEIRAMTVTIGGQLIVAGSTTSPDYPVVNPVQGELAGVNDAFVTILNAAGSALEFSTYLGGLTNDWAEGVAVDPQGGLALAGTSFSGVFFPTVNAFQSQGGGSEDAFLARFSPGDYRVVYATLLGGAGDDYAASVAIGPSGASVVSGLTRSPNFPLVSPLQPAFGGEADGFVAKFDAGGAPVFSTFLGGNTTDHATAVGMDASGRVFVAGHTVSEDFPVVDAFQATRGGTPGSFSFDAFIAQLDANGAIEFSSYLGGSAEDTISRLALDRAGSAYLSGATQSADFPISPHGPQQAFGGVLDGLLAKVGPACAVDVTASVAAGALLSIPIPLTPWHLELFLVRNQSSEPIGSPIGAVFSGLQNAVLVNAIGTTDCTGAPGSPFIVVPPGPEGWLEPGEVTGAWLLFHRSGAAAPSYQSVVLSGVPGRNIP